MPQNVSKNHKILIEKVRKLFPEKEIIGWPDAEMNLGHFCGLTNCNLRADIFIWWNDSHTKAIVIEYQSEIHSLKKANTWFNPDEIKGRDDLKKDLIARSGLGFLEIDKKMMKELSDREIHDLIVEEALSSSVDEAISIKKFNKFNSNKKIERTSNFPKKALQSNNKLEGGNNFPKRRFK